MLWWQAIRRSRFGIAVLPLSSGSVTVYAPNESIPLWLIDTGKRNLPVAAYKTFAQVQEWMQKQGYEWNYNWQTLEFATRHDEEWYGRNRYKS